MYVCRLLISIIKMYISLNKLIFIYFHLSYTSNTTLCPSFNFFRKSHQYMLGSTSYFKARNRSLDSYFWTALIIR
ncbi:unnamed protein product [Meloidogyne enterolobii]|uniref:Uncharacterized protein n=1 Tax=Meloidogyne enterolobii TaxID=390850 RepID=A0ACB0Z1Z0_MELEN